MHTQQMNNTTEVTCTYVVNLKQNKNPLSNHESIPFEDLSILTLIKILRVIN